MGRPLGFQLSAPRFILDAEPNCAGTDPEIFYSQDTYSPGSLRTVASTYRNEREAKQVCKECPLIMQCLEFAMDNHEMGIWGGTTERDRQRIRSSLGRPGAARTRSYL